METRSPDSPITPQSAGGLRVLIVEDHEDCAESLSELLLIYGHEPQIACNGPNAIQMFGIFDPDVVLLDLGLPGMSGLKLARHLSSAKSGERPLIVAVTGHGRQCDRDEAAEAGIDIHLLKPVNPALLKRTLDDFYKTLFKSEL